MPHPPDHGRRPGREPGAGHCDDPGGDPGRRAVAGRDDRHDIVDLLATFAHAIDSCDWPRYRSVFTDEIELDYSSYRPGSVGRWSADEWVARAARLFPGFTCTRHALTNVLATIDGDRASVRANVCAEHVIVDAGRVDVYAINGYYDDRCVRTADGWRIAAKRLVVLWETGDAGVMARGRSRAAG